MKNDETKSKGIILDTPDPPNDLPYADFEDYRAKELLKVNNIELTEQSLLSALNSEEDVFKGAAAHVLGSLGSTAVITALEQLCDNSDDLVKVEAAYALVRLGVKEYSKVLQNCLNYPVNAYLCPPIAAGDLARLGDSIGFPVIFKCLDIDNLIVRIIACKQLTFFVPFQDLLSDTGQPIDVYALFNKALNDQHRDVQWIALWQLREIHSLTARKLLEDFIGKTTDEKLF